MPRALKLPADLEINPKKVLELLVWLREVANEFSAWYQQAGGKIALVTTGVR